MKALESMLETWVLAYLLNSLWQVPLVFCAALAVARLARKAGPQMEHRVWVAALIAESVLPACHLQWNDLWLKAWGLALWIRGGSVGSGETRIILGDGTTSGSLPWLTGGVLAAVTAAYACALLYFAGRLAWSMWTTDSMRRRAVRLELNAETARKIDSFSPLIGIGRGEVRIASSPAIAGPATVGFNRQVLLLPPGFLDSLSAAEFDAVLAHEFAHMRRRDFAKNLLYGLLSLPAAYHPLLSLTRARVAETRELVCDAMAAEAAGGRECYAKSLLRLASLLSVQAAPTMLHAIGIFDANIFERRVMHLTRRNFELKGVRRVAIAAACFLVALVTCASALALRMEVTEPSDETPAHAKIHVKPENLKIVSKVQPVYPVEAKKAKIQGSVVLSATIGKDGAVENLHVVSGPSALQAASLDAVRQWRYEPFLLNGDPVEVETQITVMFTLSK